MIDRIRIFFSLIVEADGGNKKEKNSQETFHQNSGYCKRFSFENY